MLCGRYRDLVRVVPGDSDHVSTLDGRVKPTDKARTHPPLSPNMINLGKPPVSTEEPPSSADRPTRKSERVEMRTFVHFRKAGHRKYEVTLLDDCRGESLVCIPARDIRERRFGTDEPGNCILEITMNRERAADESNASRSRAEFLETVDSCLHN